MSSGLFCFLQVELPSSPGPGDGRWLLRNQQGELERVVVLRTVGARRADLKLSKKRRGRRVPVPPLQDRETATTDRVGGDGRARASAETQEPSKTRTDAEREEPGKPRADDAIQPPDGLSGPIAVTRATIIDPVTLSRPAAESWLSDLKSEQAAIEAATWLGRLASARRIAAADPYAQLHSPTEPIALRAGFGEGEQVAEGRWTQALELAPTRLRRSARGRATFREAHVHGRIAGLLGGRSEALLCEELALRARLDLDHGRNRHAAVELDRAYAAALHELPSYTARFQLEHLHKDVTALGAAALEPGSLSDTDEQTLRHALSRLEAALRAYAHSETGWF